MAAQVDMVVDQGTDFSVKVYLQQANTSPLDITGGVVTATIVSVFGDDPIDFPCTVQNAANGQFSMDLSAQISGSMDWGRYVYDCVFVDASSVTTRLFAGNMRVDPGVTGF